MDAIVTKKANELAKELATQATFELGSHEPIVGIGLLVAPPRESLYSTNEMPRYPLFDARRRAIMWGKGSHDEFPLAQNSNARIVAERRQNIAPGFSPE